MPVKEEKPLRLKNRCIKDYKTSIFENMTDQGEKECSTPRKPKNCIVLYCTRIVYLSSNTFLSLRGRHKKGRGGEGEKSAKGKREREPFLLSSITSFTPPSV